MISRPIEKTVIFTWADIDHFLQDWNLDLRACVPLDQLAGKRFPTACQVDAGSVNEIDRQDWYTDLSRYLSVNKS